MRRTFKQLPGVFGLIFSLLATAACAADAAPAAARQWVAGSDYLVLDPPQPTSTGGKIEVVEVFSYACPHCAHFQPYIDELKSKLPASAQFVLLPAVFNAAWEPFARAFYTAQALGLVDKTHQALFDALHRDHLPIGSIDALAKFYAGYGADSATFLSTANSFVIEAKMAHGNELVRGYHIEGTPTLIVNGKYRVAMNSERNIGPADAIQLTLYLVQQEAAKAQGKAGN
ncbi:MAG TPA: thiol:disulfide interchange protein DsbA/DsbL [Rudaea sp.]|nr:thiol:disulfide interchange protein DsbA/DsbL [Rudaea sp.]